jgi:hypothetical protein
MKLRKKKARTSKMNNPKRSLMRKMISLYLKALTLW